MEQPGGHPPGAPLCNSPGQNNEVMHHTIHAVRSILQGLPEATAHLVIDEMERIVGVEAAPEEGVILLRATRDLRSDTRRCRWGWTDGHGLGQTPAQVASLPRPRSRTPTQAPNVVSGQAHSTEVVAQQLANMILESKLELHRLEQRTSSEVPTSSECAHVLFQALRRTPGMWEMAIANSRRSTMSSRALAEAFLRTVQSRLYDHGAKLCKTPASCKLKKIFFDASKKFTPSPLPWSTSRGPTSWSSTRSPTRRALLTRCYC